MSQEELTMQSSKVDVWYLKEIRYGLRGQKKSLKVVTQNFNGPCSFIAICNILILRGNIHILPLERQTVSYEFLSQLVAEYLLTTSPDVDVSAALSIMPTTQKGMDLNPLFIASTSFRPNGISGGELKLFEQVGILLVHGWLVDPESPEAPTLKKIQDYDTSVQLIAEADHLTNGRFVVSESSYSQAISSNATGSSSTFSAGEQAKIEDALVIRRFLDTTSSQLTYFGLFHLAATLAPGSLVALFRNSHLSVLYKSEEEDAALYTLVTDQVFLQEPSVVWERLEDVDGGWSTFVDSDFVRSTPVGGDFSGQTAEEALRAAELEAGYFLGTVDPTDHFLAQQLQAEEEKQAREERESYLLKQRRRQDEQRLRAEQELEKIQRKKKKSDCIIM